MSHDHEPITLGIMQYTWFSWKVVLYIFSTSELSEKVVIKMLYKEKTTIILNFDQSCILCFDYKPFYHEPRSLTIISRDKKYEPDSWTELNWTWMNGVLVHFFPSLDGYYDGYHNQPWLPRLRNRLLCNALHTLLTLHWQKTLSEY